MENVQNSPLSPQSTQKLAVADVNLNSLLASLSSAIPTTLALTTTSQTARSSGFLVSLSPALVSRTANLIATVTSDSGVNNGAVTSTTSAASVSNSTSAATIGLKSTTSNDGKATTIIIAVILGVAGFFLLLGGMFLIRRYRERRLPFGPFSSRGATPVDDDEIASWRGQPMAQIPSTPTKEHRRSTSMGNFSHHTPSQQDWPWSSEISPRTFISDDHSKSHIITQAPNARSGLTDETKPGDAAFVATHKRNSSKLSKLPGHYRTKSRASSMSASVRDRPNTAGTWFDPEDPKVQSYLAGGRGESFQFSRDRTASMTSRMSLEKAKSSQRWQEAAIPPFDAKLSGRPLA